METTTITSCNTSTLAPYIPSVGNPWDISKVKHVYRRLGFSASIADVDAALALTPSILIDNIVDSAFNLPVTPAPAWGFYALSDFTDFENENTQYLIDWRIQAGNDFFSETLRGRLAFFWSNHFVTQLETYFYAPYLFQYYNVLQTYALGNFKDFTNAIGKNPAMLLYLNGFENTNLEPNENYARELFELFTLGEGNNYTQMDITETSRALTGYNHWAEPGAAITFNTSTHDAGTKLIFDQEGPWGYDDVIDILFNERGSELAHTICRKLYAFFVSPEVDATIETNIIQPLAQTFITSNFELVPVLKQLFKSEHFFDEKALGVIIKSPFDTIFNFIKEGDFFYDDVIMEAILQYSALMGQQIFDPPDVSGWQRDEDWINGSTLTGRWQLMELYINYLFANGYEFTLTDLARELSNDSNDPAFIAEVMVNHFVPKNLHTASDYVTATNILKWEVPQNYYDDGIWNLNWSTAPLQVSLLLKHIARMPEFQLK
jgi:hypothetical protein